MVADEVLRAALLAKVSDKQQLIRLLTKAESPGELKVLLDTLETAKVEPYLDFRTAMRARVAALRARHQPQLDAEPAIEKDLQAAEATLKDPIKAPTAENQINDVARRLADLDFQSGIKPPVIGVVVEENKFNYLFGKATPDPHNTPRSAQNQKLLEQIGFCDDEQRRRQLPWPTLSPEESRAAIRAHLERVPENPNNVIGTSPGREEFKKFPQQSAFEGHWGGPTEIRQSILFGPNGQLSLESTWEVRYGTRRLTTVIPKAPK
jgi:hypothetical protein